MAGLEAISDTWPYLVIGLMFTGACAGILAGLLGVGGGIVVVPVLFWILGALEFSPELSMHMAVGTSLLTIIPTSISSMRSHYKRGTVDVELVKRWGIVVAIAALAGGIAAKYIDGNILRTIFGFVALLASINMLSSKQLVLDSRLPSPKKQQGIAGGIGFISSLMGIGGGTLTVPVLSIYSYPVHKAVGTASVFGLLIALPATLGFMFSGMGVEGRPPFSLGYVSLIAGFIIFPLGVLFAPLGAKLAHILNPANLKRAFAVFLGFTALRMLVSVFGV